MPPKNADALSGYAVILADGRPCEIVNVDDLSERAELPPECGPYIPISWMYETVLEMCGNKRTLNCFRYGWKARGPVRKRLLQRLRTRPVQWGMT